MPTFEVRQKVGCILAILQFCLSERTVDKLVIASLFLKPKVTADCGLFAMAFATALAYGEQPGHFPFNQSKVRQHQLKSLQDGEITPLPLKKNRRNGRRVKTWNTIQIRLYLQDANGLGTSIMHDWPSIRVRETPIYASSLHS